ncbi:MAG TPA: UvrD-helicase domain-containing protein [Blastocatellia bacterium]|nr:UvrD-helicase domain-containing protein [Blastocatellia bacterium]
MRSLKRSRDHAHTCRAKIGASSEHLLERVEKYLFDVHGIELIPVTIEFLKGGRAEVVPAEGCLYYQENFDQDLAEKLMVVLHELGHLELHPRLQRRCTVGDPLTGSMYLNDGGPAIARYNRRSREEAEANAFATEFFCPSDEVFDRWRNEVDANSVTLAEAFDAPVYVVQAQLAEALSRRTLGVNAAEASTRREFECDLIQEEAARFTGAPVLVNAGPGTGKTATLVRRIEYLITELGAKPDSILVLTFSTEAVEELIERVERRLKADVINEITISTFHGFGVSFLLHHGQFRDIDANAYILDEAGQAELVTCILGKVNCERILNIKRPQETVEEIVRHIGYLKDRLYLPDRLSNELAKWKPTDEEWEVYTRAEEFLGVYRAYEQAKSERHRLDFADLIALPIEILAQEKAVRDAYHARYKWVLVDEYQDVSRSVSGLLQLLCSVDNPPWVVGDVRQSILQFLGASPENVTKFPEDFPGAKVFELDTNYRSSLDIIKAANQLAALMEAPELESSKYAERWKISTENPESIGSPPVSAAIADSDQAEYEGIAAQVQAWSKDGVPLRDIAVLARRNIDVRNIVLALGKLGVQATTSGLVTADGAAGDLANLITFADRQHTSLPRLAFALGRGSFKPKLIHRVVKRLLETLEKDGSFAVIGYRDGNILATEVARASECLRSGRYNADAFTMMCLFLFDGSNYLRRILAQPEGAERYLALSEIVASLSKAAIYRFTHQEATPIVSRKGFGEYFRGALNSSMPCLMPPQSNINAVRVMTCHASKGLEFPCVVVTGQTLSRAAKGYKWLPPAMQPRVQDDTDQANSLAFVGVTRAQQAVMITYAVTASGSARAREREITPLLDRWRNVQNVPTVLLSSVLVVRETAMLEAVWGGTLDRALAARSLDKENCPINTYIRDFLGARYPLNETPLYPLFHAFVRHAMRLIIERAHETGAPVSEQEACEIFLKIWNAGEISDHPHREIYEQRALAYVARMALAYIPPPGQSESLELTIWEEETELPLRLDLIAQYRKSDGESVAILFRPESLKEFKREKGLLWGALSSGKRVPFVLLRLSNPHIKPFVFSGEDGELYPYLWGKDKDFEKEATRVRERFKAFGRSEFQEQISPHKCDQCDSRIPCPHWLVIAMES